MDSLVFIVAALGFIAGILVNALADDLPHHRTPRLPRYPDGTPRPLLAWSGITAFLIGKRASPKGVKLSWRYPLAEIATIVLMLFTLSQKLAGESIVLPANGGQLAFWIAYMPIFVLITVIDLEHKLILFSVMIPAYILALLDAYLAPPGPWLGDALLGGLFGGVTFYILYLGGFLFVRLSNRMRGQPITEVAFGFGDVMLAIFSGMILGWPPIIFALYITILLGALGAALWILSRRLSRTGYSMFTALPYGPYIVAGTLIILLFSSVVRYFMVGW